MKKAGKIKWKLIGMWTSDVFKDKIVVKLESNIDSEAPTEMKVIRLYISPSDLHHQIGDHIELELFHVSDG